MNVILINYKNIRAIFRQGNAALPDRVKLMALSSLR